MVKNFNSSLGGSNQNEWQIYLSYLQQYNYREEPYKMKYFLEIGNAFFSNKISAPGSISLKPGGKLEF